MEEPKPKRLLRLKQVLERIPVGKVTWYRGINDGRFPKGVLVGRMRMWRESDIDAWIEGLDNGEK